MGRQNFAAGLEMTIGNVVRNYLRWFELNKYKKALARLYRSTKYLDPIQYSIAEKSSLQFEGIRGR